MTTLLALDKTNYYMAYSPGPKMITYVTRTRTVLGNSGMIRILMTQGGKVQTKTHILSIV